MQTQSREMFPRQVLIGLVTICLIVMLAVLAAVPRAALSLQPPSIDRVSAGDQQIPFFLQGLLVGVIIPDFEARDIEGNNVSSKDLAGEPIYLRFWSPNCAYCVAETPYVQGLYEELKDQYQFLTVVSNVEPEQISEFAQQHSIEFPILLDETGQLSAAFQVRAIPYTYYIGADGVIQQTVIGAQNQAQQVCDSTVEEHCEAYVP